MNTFTDLPDVDFDSEKEKLLRQLYPENYKDIPVSGSKTHLSGTFTSDDDNGGSAGAPGNGSSHQDDNQKSRKRRHLETEDKTNKPQKLCTVAYYDARTTGIYQLSLTLFPICKQALVFTCLQYKSLKNTVGKGEIAHTEQFLLFP